MTAPARYRWFRPHARRADPAWQDYIGAGVLGLQAARARAPVIFARRGRADDRPRTASRSTRAGSTAAAQAAMAADIARRDRGRALLRPAHPLGQADERAHDHRRPLRLVLGPRGYRYVDRHPSGVPWPPIPASVLAVWGALASPSARRPTAASSTSTAAPRAWASTRTATRRTSPGRCSRSGSATARSSAWAARSAGTRPRPSCSDGDVVLIGGPARLAYHGIDRVRRRARRLLPEGGRINLTLRVVD